VAEAEVVTAVRPRFSTRVLLFLRLQVLGSFVVGRGGHHALDREAWWRSRSAGNAVDPPWPSWVRSFAQGRYLSLSLGLKSSYPRNMVRCRAVLWPVKMLGSEASVLRLMAREADGELVGIGP